MRCVFVLLLSVIVGYLIFVFVNRLCVFCEVERVVFIRERICFVFGVRMCVFWWIVLCKLNVCLLRLFFCVMKCLMWCLFRVMIFGVI